MRWKYLSQSEKVVCLGIILIPLWWFWGWSYLLLFLALGLITHDIYKYGYIQLNAPSLIVKALVIYGSQELINNIFYSLDNSASLGARDFLDAVNQIFSPAFILWYIQSKKIRVQFPVVAWAFSAVVIFMVGSWAYIFLIQNQVTFEPPRSLFGFLTNKPLQYVPGLGNSNYLIPYRAEDSSIAGLVRYFYFFHGPESLALTCAFICLLSIDIKSQFWRSTLFIGTFFILLTSGTRSVWITLPFTIFVLFLGSVGKSKNSWLTYAFICLLCMFTLVIQPVANVASNTVTDTVNATSEFRGDSTDVRAEIYRRTYEEVLDSTLKDFLFGHVVTGETVLPGYAPAMIGTHSFYLGSLLYIRGVLGVVLFLIYWVSLIKWLIETRTDRPIGCIAIFFLFSCNFYVMAFESVVMPITLIAVTVRKQKMNNSIMQLKKHKHMASEI